MPEVAVQPGAGFVKGTQVAWDIYKGVLAAGGISVVVAIAAGNLLVIAGVAVVGIGVATIAVGLTLTAAAPD